jgi:hypothetical protein
MKGLTAPAIKNKTALRASISALGYLPVSFSFSSLTCVVVAAGSIFMDEVPVPAEQMLDVQGLKGPFSCLKCVRSGAFVIAIVPDVPPVTATLASVSALVQSVRWKRRSASLGSTHSRGSSSRFQPLFAHTGLTLPRLLP